jgi:TolB-like protein/Tfp pilus assembly protein PilF
MFDPLRNDPRFQKLVATGIAVLPFENRSEDRANAYFVDGIQDEILTRLSKIADLKVIARTSTQQYKSAPRNLPEIAKQLGVAHILEGSVQKSGDAVRVNVQLIKAANGSHLWADTFDRKLTDVLSVESEVAKTIADQLRATLTGQEEQVIAAKPTDNPEAYDAYLRGLAYTLKAGNAPANDLAAQKYLREAVRLDPKFALGWALLSYVDADGYRSNTLPITVALREEAQQAAETALTLQPNLGEAVLAKGRYHYSCLRDYDTAVRYFEQARQLLPNNSRILESLAFLERRRGHWDRSESYFNEAEQLDPRNVHLLTHHAETYKMLRRFPEALRKLDQVLNITPDDVDILSLKAAIAQAEGDLPRAAALLAPLHPSADNPEALGTQVYQAILERRPAQIIPRLKEILAKSDPALSYSIGGLRFCLGWAQEVAGDHAAAQESWRQERSELESFRKEQPETPELLELLALTNMGLGDKTAALALSEQAVATNPIEKDALLGPASIEVLARVAAQIGEPDRAIAALEKLLSIPCPTFISGTLTPALLRLDPMFDPLRNDPRFQKLVATGIAVLPFENRSEDKANAYFADAIQDEILTRLSKIADLKVISRTSTQHYKNAPRNLSEIAKQLGVAHILEGSVQKSGDTVRVNVQLIKAANDSHLWADTFDRKLIDIFSVESEIAKSIADQLRVQLSSQEEQAIAAKPTDNPEAYDTYLRGLAYTLKAGNNSANDLAAQKYLREAVRLDPKFALGWALLSWLDAAGYRSTSLQPTVALREEARQAAETALTLQPNLGEAVLAKGEYHYACLRDYDTAVRYFDQARQLLPNNSLILESLAYLERRRGHWDRSESYFNEAERLDPRNAHLLFHHAVTYKLRRRFPEALRKFDQVLNVTPDDVDTLAEKASIAQAEGDLPRAAALLAPLHPNADNDAALGTQVYQAILERRSAQIIPRLKEILAKPDPALGYINGALRFWLGWAQEVAGDHASANETWRQARSELESFLKEQPESPELLELLALTNMDLGDKAAALALSERNIAANPIEKDALSGPESLEIFARVTAQMGEPDRAIAALQKLLSIPYGGLFTVVPLTPALLRLDPMFDPLRNDPRFQKLVAAPTPR